MSWIFQFFFWKDSLKKEKAEGKETEISEKDREKSWEEAAHTPYGLIRKPYTIPWEKFRDGIILIFRQGIPMRTMAIPGI